MPPLITSVRPHAEERRVPEHQVGELARLDRADLAVEPVRDRRADRVLRDVAPGPQVVGRAVAGQRAPAASSSTCAVCQVRMITSPTRPIACESEPIIEIAPRSCSRSSAAIVDGRIRRLGERQVLGHRRVEVVADHQHVEVLVDGVHGVRPGRVGRGRQHVAAAPATVMMSGACPPPAPSVWYAWIAPAGDRARGCPATKPASFSVSVWIATCTPVCVGHPQAGVDRGGRRAPVLVQLEPGRSRPRSCSRSASCADGVALAEQRDVDRPGVQRLQHPRQVPGAGRDGGGLGALGRARCRRRSAW